MQKSSPVTTTDFPNHCQHHFLPASVAYVDTASRCCWCRHNVRPMSHRTHIAHDDCHFENMKKVDKDSSVDCTKLFVERDGTNAPTLQLLMAFLHYTSVHACRHLIGILVTADSSVLNGRMVVEETSWLLARSCSSLYSTDSFPLS